MTKCILILFILSLVCFILLNVFSVKENYKKWQDTPCVPEPFYYRYGSNLADPTQDTLPITLPDPDYDEDVKFKPKNRVQEILCGLKYSYYM